MNAFLWILQAVLALLYVAGGAYKVFRFEDVADQPWYGALPRGGWGALGVIEMLGAVLLVAPAAVKRMQGLTPLAAAALAVESLALAGVYARYSLALTAANPLVWCVAMGVMAVFVAYGRYSLEPPA